MKKTTFGIFLSALVLIGLSSCNPKRNDSKFLINEVMMDNQTNCITPYGDHTPWIEIFNKSYNTADLAGSSIKMSNTPGDTVSYIIPKGDILTKVTQRNQILFYADGDANRGTFHTNFTLDPAKATWIALYDTRMHLLDQITIPVNTISTDQSYGRRDDGTADWEVKGGNDPTKYVTPGANNQIKEASAKMDKFAKQDKSGLGMAITAMSVVFFALLLLYLSFRSVGKYFSHRDEKKVAAAVDPVSEQVAEKQTAKTAASDDVYAAIAMAIYEYQGGMHDVESNVITIIEDHSAWNSKAEMMRQKPIRKF
ncbi:MAG: OadG family transporter subunit [Phocaeicola sp.]|uniref:OadG family transporter subunit n=1 Tax=Phocaeicola TaxID=909656 RepID=UPI00234E9B5C|nr:OadG family transporter subunit [Phocaeicola oris]MCE2615781.1 OadG family protein [Phocaeicola oris]